MFLTLPYVFSSEEHYWKFTKSDLAKEMLAEAKEVGQPWTGLAYGEEGFRHFFSKVDIKTIDDLKGLKIRVSDDPIMTGLLQGLGAAFTPVSFTELYSALQTGVVDCAEQPITNYLSNSFQEVAPYMLRDGHTLGTIELIATDSCFDKLSDDQKALVQQAADYAMAECEKSVIARRGRPYNKLDRMGCTVNEVEDKASGRKPPRRSGSEHRRHGRYLRSDHGYAVILKKREHNDGVQGPTPAPRFFAGTFMNKEASGCQLYLRSWRRSSPSMTGRTRSCSLSANCF